MLCVHIVHDDDGRILAVADGADTPWPGGRMLHHQPRPRPGQHAILVTLTIEQQELHALTLIRDFDLDREASPPGLRRRDP